MAAFTNWADAWQQFQAGQPGVKANLMNLYNIYGTIYTASTLTALRQATAQMSRYVYYALTGITGISWSETVMESYLWAVIYFAHGGGDMDGILNAMLQADYEQLQQFVGIVDAYRSAIWDQPFNAEFYAALARGFRP